MESRREPITVPVDSKVLGMRRDVKAMAPVGSKVQARWRDVKAMAPAGDASTSQACQALLEVAVSRGRFSLCSFAAVVGLEAPGVPRLHCVHAGTSRHPAATHDRRTCL